MSHDFGSSAAPLLRTIHVGVGNRGQWPLRFAVPTSGFQPVALVDTNPALLAEASRNHPGIPTFADLEAALATVEADAAILCSPTRFHLAQGQRCLATGLHVLVEKGMAPTLAAARELVSAAASARRALCVAQNYRYQAMERTVARLISDPDHPCYIGEPFLIDYTQHRQRPHPRTLDYPFASVWDMSCHHFDTLLSWLGGGFEAVTAKAFGPPWSRYVHPNNTSLQLTHRRGCTVHYLHTHDAAINEVRIRIQGRWGAVVVDEASVRTSRRSDAQLQHEPLVAVTPEAHLGEAGVLADFYRHAVRNEPVGISGSENLNVMALCDATCRAADSGESVSLAAHDPGWGAAPRLEINDALKK